MIDCSCTPADFLAPHRRIWCPRHSPSSSAVPSGWPRGWRPPSRRSTAPPTCRRRWRGWPLAAPRPCRSAPAGRWRSCAARRSRTSWRAWRPRCLGASASCCTRPRVSERATWCAQEPCGGQRTEAGECAGCLLSPLTPPLPSSSANHQPAAEEILHLVLETLTAAVKAAPEAAAQWEQQISGGCGSGGETGRRPAGAGARGGAYAACGPAQCAPGAPPSSAEPALNAWVANVADPLLSIDARELLEALASLPACLPALQARRCPAVPFCAAPCHALQA